MAVALPDTPLGEHARWILDSVNEESATLAEEIPERVAAPLLDQVPADQLVMIIEQLRAEGPWQPTAVEDGGDQALITLTSAGGEAHARGDGGDRRARRIRTG